MPRGPAQAENEAPSSSHGNTRPFRLLVLIGVCDSSVRMACLTFLPFLLLARGGTSEVIGLALALVFVGGATGKFVCGWLGARVGPIAAVLLTEIATAGMIVVVIRLPLVPALACLPLLGVALNGTSSVLYGSVAELVPVGGRQRAFAVFYTAVVAANAVAPVFAGVAVDRTGLEPALLATAGVALLVVPLALLLRPAFQPVLSDALVSPSR